VLGSFAVNVAVALLSTTVALTLSVWGSRPYEVLLATYLVLGVWLLALPLWLGLASSWGLGLMPDGLKIGNPFVLLVAPSFWPTGVPLDAYGSFVGVSVGLSALLTLLAILSLRRAARRDKVRRTPRHWHWPRLFRFRPALDFNPVLWREWQRRPSSRWLRNIWAVFALLSCGATALALAEGTSGRGNLAAFVNGFQFSIGLLLVSVTAVASLFEERVNGSLDVLLATPLPTTDIVWGKWVASYRGALQVTLLPMLLACGVYMQQMPLDNAGMVALLLALMLAYGALVTSLGLALATWVPRFGVAVGLTVTIYVLLAAGPILLLLAGPHNRDMEGFACVSPWFGVGETTYFLSSRHQPSEHVGWKMFWLFAYAVAALALALATRRTFDRCLGRATVWHARPRGRRHAMNAKSRI
jgi:ABC-type transport system involved in multi-copper enzyme maturation permease subunit